MSTPAPDSPKTACGHMLTRFLEMYHSEEPKHKSPSSDMLFATKSTFSDLPAAYT